MAEAQAAFAEDTDVQIGRLIDSLEDSGQMAILVEVPLIRWQRRVSRDRFPTLIHTDDDRAEVHELAAEHPTSFSN